jgi:hypothetical protein
MRKAVGDSKKKVKKIRYLFAGLFFCFFTAEILAQAGSAVADYPWLQQTTVDCAGAQEERIFQLGFSEDWQSLELCENPLDLWWVLELKPKTRLKNSTDKSVVAAVDRDVIFQFEIDFMTRWKNVTTEKYTGPPKWMPPDQAYWDPAIGDWRYIKINLNDDLDKPKTGSELVLLWMKYEHSEDGLILDASFDINRLMELFNIDFFRVNGLLSRVFDFISLGD